MVVDLLRSSGGRLREMPSSSDRSALVRPLDHRSAGSATLRHPHFDDLLKRGWRQIQHTWTFLAIFGAACQPCQYPEYLVNRRLLLTFCFTIFSLITRCSIPNRHWSVVEREMPLEAASQQCVLWAVLMHGVSTHDVQQNSGLRICSAWLRKDLHSRDKVV
ncbi:uncharacterized protein BJX67DRAFT_269311 [Aspergillus lucknowensis]|uniref:Uncharacterized protein n=1 Tax=Aspergillus lucknowensis TaxID=176173 RepID=A0ABR4LEU8_9EURO